MSVVFSVPIDEYEALSRSLGEVLPRERFVVILGAIEIDASPPRGPHASLHVYMPTANHEAALAEATELVEAAVLRARMANAVTLIGVREPWFGDSPVRRLREEARRHIQMRRYDVAVIRCQSALELFAQEALDVLTAPLRAPSSGRVYRSVNLLDARDRALVEALTGVPIDLQPWWPDYATHVERRNEVVHRGLMVEEAGAQASMEATQEMMSLLGWLSRGQPPDPFDQSGRPGPSGVVLRRTVRAGDPPVGPDESYLVRVPLGRRLGGWDYVGMHEERGAVGMGRVVVHPPGHESFTLVDEGWEWGDDAGAAGLRRLSGALVELRAGPVDDSRSDACRWRLEEKLLRLYGPDPTLSLEELDALLRAHNLPLRGWP